MAIEKFKHAETDAGSTGNDTLIVSGTITLVWSNLGDV